MAKKDTEVAEKQPINTRELANLRRILKGRRELLDAQMEARIAQIKRGLRRGVIAETADARAAFQPEVKAFQAKVRALAAEGEELLARMHEQGVTFGLESDERQWADQSVKRVYYTGELVQRQSTSRYDNDEIHFEIDGDVIPKDLDERVEVAYDKLADDKGFAKIAVQETFLDLDEELSRGQITSDEANAFLDKIPSVDKLLPMNGNGRAELEA